MLRWQACHQADVYLILERYGIALVESNPDADIPGSFWGEEEAGLIGNKLYVRPDTPLHSLLHEGCHYICMSPDRRKSLDTNAGGDYDEENAVCYLQILLSDHISGFDKVRCFTDMDTWGYSFRLGSAKAWFDQDAEDAQLWLFQHNIIDGNNCPTWEVRKT